MRSSSRARRADDMPTVSGFIARSLRHASRERRSIRSRTAEGDGHGFERQLPAQAGIDLSIVIGLDKWVPAFAFAGMTGLEVFPPYPAQVAGRAGATAITPFVQTGAVALIAAVCLRADQLDQPAAAQLPR